MNFLKTFSVFVLAIMLTLSGCAPKDSKIKENVETKLKVNQATAGVTVLVNEGVATLSGQVDTEAAQMEAETLAKDAKGVKSVVNNIIVKGPEVMEPVVIAADSTLQAPVRDATKDYPTVTATIQDGVITLNGSIQRDKLQDLMASLNALQPKRIINNLTIN